MAMKIDLKFKNTEEFSEAAEAVKEAATEAIAKINDLNDAVNRLNAAELKLITTTEEE